MDRRSWPWKKKSSDKAAAAEKGTLDSSSVPSDSTASQGDQAKQDRKPKYVQISVESYSHLTGLEDEVKSFEEQVKTLEDEVKELNEKLSDANVEMINRDKLVKQHAKVAEEAVSGWEKAEAEAAALKSHLESVTLLKLTAEDRASHLDGALKECMRQIRNLKEEHEQNLQEVILNKTKQFDKVKLELESKIANLDQQLLRSAAENAAISRSLQERSNLLIKLSEEKSQAEAEIEHLRNNIESCEREVNSLKYELHIARKELEIRNEEKNMSVRSAEVANKQHLEGVKKIAKLEAECQRLRGLVRKKLPGPAALAQMKLEVESLGRDHGETRLRKSPGKPSNSTPLPLPEYSFDSVQKYHKDNELLTERLLAMEEETKMLKEALAKRNSELQASRSICAKTESKLQILEARLQENGDQKGILKSNVPKMADIPFSLNASNQPSLASMSEDGNDDEVSVTGSWATALMSELSHFKKVKDIDSPRKSENADPLKLMDDFLEMEKLAYLSGNSNQAASASDVSNNASADIVNPDTSVQVTAATECKLKEHDELSSSEHKESSVLEVLEVNRQPDADPPPLVKLQSRINAIFESTSENSEIEKVLGELRRALEDMQDIIYYQSTEIISAGADVVHGCEPCPENAELIGENEISFLQDSSRPCSKGMHNLSEELECAIAQIHDFIMLLGKEAKVVQVTSPRGDELSKRLDEFSTTYIEVSSNKSSLSKFVLDLSRVLREASEFHFNILGYKDPESEMGISDCIDKVALPENKGSQGSGERYPNGCAHFSDAISDPDIPNDGNLIPTSESTATSWKCSSEEFQQLKLEKDKMVTDLARCTENLESTKSQLQETEQLLAEVKSQLISSQKLNSLADTQLKCMAESYKSLETRAEELQTEVNLLQTKIESLENDLQEERKGHEDALSRCIDLQEKLQRMESCHDSDVNARTNQDKEFAGYADKLAECQETIFLLSKQLKAFRPQAEFMRSQQSDRSEKAESFFEEETSYGFNSQSTNDQDGIETGVSFLQKVGSESPVDVYSVPFSPSDSDAINPLRSPVNSKHPKHMSTKSGSSSSSTPTPEKHPRGFSRFFSSKGKSGS